MEFLTMVLKFVHLCVFLSLLSTGLSNYFFCQWSYNVTLCMLSTFSIFSLPGTYIGLFHHILTLHSFVFTWSSIVVKTSICVRITEYGYPNISD